MAGTIKFAARNASLHVWDVTGASRAVTGNTNNATLSITVDTPDVTCFGDTDRVIMMGGLRDWTLDFDGFYTTGASTIDECMGGIVTGSTYFRFYPEGSGAASTVNYTACAVCTKYDMKFAVAGAAEMSATLRNRAGSMTRTACYVA